MRPLDRLIRPRSIAIIGGGDWCANVVRECRKIGYDGKLFTVHPTKPDVGGIPTVPTVADLPEAPDAAFIGVNRATTIEVVSALSGRGAGGAVCFASGFREADAELGDGSALQDRLIEAAADMPILGPNCYGFINALDGAALWPDQHGTTRVETGVAIITQSSNIAINLTMQERGVPLAYILTAGNQAQTGLSELGQASLQDPRVTALGLHIEGLNDIRAFEALAQTARDLGKPIVALKVGSSDHAQTATLSHTGSLAGSDAGARALLDRLDIAQVHNPAALLEALKILHVTGPLTSNKIASVSCSGGEASLMADMAKPLGLAFPPLSEAQSRELRDTLGPKVALANPLDYHTYIWGNHPALARTFGAMMSPEVALTCIILDFPRHDRCTTEGWDMVVDVAIETKEASGQPLAVLSTLSEAMPESVALRLLENGVVPLSGITEALEAIAATARAGENRPAPDPVLLPDQATPTTVLSEAQAKSALATHGLDIPKSAKAASPEAAAKTASKIGGPVVLKGEGAAHKTEAGLVALSLLSPEAVRTAACAMPATEFLVEEMVTGGIVELLVGVVRDPAHGFVLTLAQGGTLTELQADSASLLLPATPDDIDRALARLRIAPVFDGYRGRPGISRKALHAAIAAVEAAVTANTESWIEVEINPLICTPTRAVAADALIRLGDPE